MTQKQLYRSLDDRMVAGVCGGLGAYFNVDPTLVRLAVVFLSLWWGGGILLYLLAWFIIPEEPQEATHSLPRDGEETEESPESESVTSTTETKN